MLKLVYVKNTLFVWIIARFLRQGEDNFGFHLTAKVMRILRLRL